MKFNWRTLCLLGIFTVISFGTIRPLIREGYFPMHDDTQVARVVVMGRALRSGQIPVRWVSDLGYGYGYPIFNFYGPLPYYIGGFLYSLGVEALASTKIVFAIGIVSAGITMYFLAKEISGHLGGLIAATVYMYAPYHAVQIYVRGAVGEYYSLIFLPLVLLGCLKALRGENRQSFLMGSLGVAGVVLAHTIMGYIVTVFFICGLCFVFLLFKVYKISNLDVIKRLFAIPVGGLLFSAFFWLPALFEFQYTNVSSQIGGGAEFFQHFVCFSQFWNSQWGFAGSAPGCTDGMSFMLGKLSLLLSIAAVIFWYRERSKIKGEIGVFLSILLVVFVLSVILMTSVSEPLWRLVPGFSYIQYPWRFLTLAIIPLSLFPSTLLWYIKQKIVRRIGTVVLIGIIVLFNKKFFIPQTTYVRPSSDFESVEELRWRVSRISDEYLPKDIEKPTSVENIVKTVIPIGDQWSVKTEVDSDVYSRFTVEGHRKSDIRVLRAYFPGWIYKVNGNIIDPRIDRGVPILPISEGTNIVELLFTQTPIRCVANIISFSTVFIVLYIYGRKKIFT